MAIQTRHDEIKAIHVKYVDVYRISGGLFVILMFVIIGGWIFGQNVFGFNSDSLSYITSVVTEILGIVGTVIIIDQLNRRRMAQEQKLAILEQAKSRSNAMAMDAVNKIQQEEWWDDLLSYYLDASGKIELTQVQWTGGVQLDAVDLHGAKMWHANLEEARLREANLQGAKLIATNLQGAKLKEANLEQASLRDANLQTADLQQADLTEAHLDSANLKRANLLGANLQNASLMWADLQQANLQQSSLQGAHLREATLQGTILYNTNLQQAKLWQTDLQEAVLYRANLCGTELFKANLKGAKLEYATFDGTTVLPDAKYIKLDDNGKAIYDKYWTPETDMSRYTDPDHPEFWQPDWVNEDETE